MNEQTIEKLAKDICAAIYENESVIVSQGLVAQVIGDALNTANDDLPIDEAWLRSMGFAIERVNWLILRKPLDNSLDLRVCFRKDSNQLTMGINERWMSLEHITTRSQLRDLFSVLKIQTTP